MLLFRRIFDFRKSNLLQIEQRHNQRYTPGPLFPLRATLQMAGRDRTGSIHNISATGVGLLLERDNDLVTGRSGQLRLALDQYELNLKARLIHAQPRTEGFFCGVTLDFEDFTLQKAYLQLLQPISIGCTLQPVAAPLVIQNEPQFTKLSFRGEANSLLSVWRENAPPAELHSFEFMMQDYFVRADAKVRVMEVFQRAQVDRPPQLKVTAPMIDVLGGANDEVRQLFRWIVPNLPAAVPGDVRGFLQSFA
jgi:PilZ domain